MQGKIQRMRMVVGLALLAGLAAGTRCNNYGSVPMTGRERWMNKGDRNT